MARALFLKYRTPNIGDDIQTLAAMAMQGIDYTETGRYELIDRDQPDYTALRHPIDEYQLDLNCWFSLAPAHRGFDLRIKQRITSIHLNHTRESITPLLPWLTEIAARTTGIGCRDSYTTELLTSLGINAYFQSCPTLQLARSTATRDSSILLVDLKGSSGQKVAPPCKVLTHRLNNPVEVDPMKRFQRAADLLEQYASCRAVITNRIHAMFPCVAMGTPVYFVDDRRDLSRFGGYEALIQQQRLEFSRNLPDIRISN
ncbi:MAG: polysaccharide pyruvyl transferase family protein [Proteobacteria bacterium]|nr:polysaccharide pyruvyl transferase family protein [Pseudomonadota bacterium]MDA1301266.1 polysaccharide pyruvyl transferase family protein [Pseudomonadota bacterium]